MDTTIIADENDRELGVFIPIKYWEEIKKAIPVISQSIADRSAKASLRETVFV